MWGLFCCWGSMFILAGSGQGTMTSLAFPVGLGSLIGVSSSGRSHSVVRRVYLSKGNFNSGKRWHLVSLFLCRYSVTTTDFIADQGTAVSLDSNPNRGSKVGDDNTGFALKPPPKPVLKSSETKGDPILGMNSESWSPSITEESDDENLEDTEERDRVIESLGEVLERAEKRENSKLDVKRNNGSVNKPAISNTIANPKNERTVNSTTNRKTKTMKGLWRKGDTVATVQKVVNEAPKPINKNEGQESQTVAREKGIKPDGVQTLDKDMVKMIFKEYDVEVIGADPVKVEDLVKKREILDEDELDKLKDRPPVITIMGHVDHGKTTLLDYIRKSKVAASEAGGITQEIGAYRLQVPVDGKSLPCVFLDTPGHEAFGAMRARGASVTDIAIIVVAADDGIRPQTNEAIAHAKAAAVPMAIAINKIDKDGANPERVMQELSSIGLMPEDWGGDIPMVQISALKGENVDDLLETVMLVAELRELKANPDKHAKGTVIEAGLDKAKGPFATFIVQNGTLRRGDIVVCGEAFGKVRALFDGGGKHVDVATPSIPVQVIGLNNVPIAGDDFEVVDSLDAAREEAETYAELLRNERISAKAGDGKVTLSALASAVSSGDLSGLDLHQLNVILKVDLQGSIEAVRQALQVLPQDNVTLKFLLETTGDVSTSDVDLAVATKAIILGFNVRAPGSVKRYAENKGVETRLYRVIYELTDDVRNAMEGLLEPVEEQVTIGTVEVRATFSSGSGCVAGCMVTEGKVLKGCGIRVIRKGKVIHVGILDSLKRVKEMVKEVNAGLECGIGLEDFDDWEEGDFLEAFNTVQKKRTLEEASESMAAAVDGVGVEL